MPAPGKIRGGVDRRLCVAPMIDWTDRHCRAFHRMLAPAALLYTEMITTGAVLRGGAERFLPFSPEDEGRVALQLGGSDPDDLARCAATAQSFGYVEVNLNCGCPSPRVQKGSFGACLMPEPVLVARCVSAMRGATPLPVTVKCRTAVDEEDPGPFLDRFAQAVAGAGCDALIVHARKAWLQGLSPKENREIPPLDHARVRRLKADLPDLPVVLNGGLVEAEQAAREAAGLDGAMIGRAAYQDPAGLPRLQAVLVPERSAPAFDLREVLDKLEAYAGRQAALGVPVKAIYRHCLGLANGIPGARVFRRVLSEGMRAPDAKPSLLREASARLSAERLAA